ncbi:hypothetical protein H0H92_006339 [Tricholoma furcatifolium]|nr:hypothetical protein H0H92_006339 [Tricholoma furcatifolium]
MIQAVHEPSRLDLPATPPLLDPQPPSEHDLSPPQLRASKTLHQGLTAQPCDEAGNYLDPNLPPPPRTAPDDDDWTLYENKTQFRVADFLYHRVQMSASNIDHLLELWSHAAMSEHDNSSPFVSHHEMYDTIDATRFGDAPWKHFSIVYNGTTNSNEAFWKSVKYKVSYRDPDAVIANMLDNPDFDGQFDYVPYVQRDQTGQRTWSDFMSGNYAWKHADAIMDEDEANEGAMYCPVILGSDKTMVSVATGHVEYYPLYLSIGNVHNTIRRAHRNAVVPIGFLAIPKLKGTSLPDNLDGPEGWCTRELTKHLLNTWGSKELWNNYGIDDSVIPFTFNFSWADIYEMLSPDLLHQLIKGTFKDHLIEWVGASLEILHGES